MTCNIFEQRLRIRSALEKISPKSSQRELAKKIGVSHGSVKRWLDGNVPDPENLKTISRLSGYSIQYLMGDDGPSIPVEKLVDAVLEVNSVDKLLDLQESFNKAVSGRLREITCNYKIS
jgi:transcriptional regulator with XRE-family HTH domain